MTRTVFLLEMLLIGLILTHGCAGGYPAADGVTLEEMGAAVPGVGATTGVPGLGASGAGGMNTTSAPGTAGAGAGTMPPSGGDGVGAMGGAGIGGVDDPLAGPGTDPGAAGASGTGGVVTAKDPTLPAIEGECPLFQTGTISFGGLGGIALNVGPKQDGTGSLVFYWHGTGSFSGEYAGMLGGVVQKILGEGGIIVSFQGSTRTGGDCSGTSTFSKDDFKIADQIAACAVRDHGIDPHRIYTTGCSAGGLQAACMATLRSGYIAAAVPNSGGLVFPQTFGDASHVPALMTMHGGSADRVIVAFSQTSATADRQFKQAGGFVLNCNHGGGHCAAPAELQAAGWEFMKTHPFGVDPEPYASGLPASFPSYCAIY